MSTYSRFYFFVAIKVFYDLNTISVDIELFKLANITSPAGSDLSLAKQLIVTFNSSYKEQVWHSRNFNTLDIDDLFKRCRATFPALEIIVVAACRDEAYRFSGANSWQI